MSEFSPLTHLDVVTGQIQWQVHAEEKYVRRDKREVERICKRLGEEELPPGVIGSTWGGLATQQVVKCIADHLKSLNGKDDMVVLKERDERGAVVAFWVESPVLNGAKIKVKPPTKEGRGVPYYNHTHIMHVLEGQGEQRDVRTEVRRGDGRKEVEEERGEVEVETVEKDWVVHKEEGVVIQDEAAEVVENEGEMKEPPIEVEEDKSVDLKKGESEGGEEEIVLELNNKGQGAQDVVEKEEKEEKEERDGAGKEAKMFSTSDLLDGPNRDDLNRSGNGEIFALIAQFLNQESIDGKDGEEVVMAGKRVRVRTIQSERSLKGEKGKRVKNIDEFYYMVQRYNSRLGDGSDERWEIKVDRSENGQMVLWQKSTGFWYVVNQKSKDALSLQVVTPIGEKERKTSLTLGAEISNERFSEMMEEVLKHNREGWWLEQYKDGELWRAWQWLHWIYKKKFSQSGEVWGIPEIRLEEGKVERRMRYWEFEGIPFRLEFIYLPSGEQKVRPGIRDMREGEQSNSIWERIVGAVFVDLLKNGLEEKDDSDYMMGVRRRLEEMGMPYLAEQVREVFFKPLAESIKGYTQFIHWPSRTSEVVMAVPERWGVRDEGEKRCWIRIKRVWKQGKRQFLVSLE